MKLVFYWILQGLPMGNISTRFSFPNKFLSAVQQLTNSIFQQTNNIVKMSIVFKQRSWIFYTSPKSNTQRSTFTYVKYINKQKVLISELVFRFSWFWTLDSIWTWNSNCRLANLRRIKFLMTNTKVAIKGK